MPAGSRPCRIRVGSSGLAFPHPLRLKKEAQNAVAAIRSIPPYPDVPPGLKKMKDAGFRMYTLTNSPGQVMESQGKNAGIAQYFDGLLTVEGLNVYKPHPRTYHRATRQSNVPIQNCMLIAAHGWDVAGARLSGMRAAFVERLGKTLYPLGPDVEFSASDLGAVADRLVRMPK